MKEWANGNHPKFMKYRGVIYHEDDLLNKVGVENYDKAIEEAEPLTKEEWEKLKQEWENLMKVQFDEEDSEVDEE